MHMRMRMHMHMHMHMCIFMCMRMCMHMHMNMYDHLSPRVGGSPPGLWRGSPAWRASITGSIRITRMPLHRA